MGSLSPRASASPVGTGAPHVGSLSLPAPTPLQQSRLSDLKGMVLHLFADAPAAAPASASTAPDLSSAAPDVPAAAADVPANASTPVGIARNSVRPARVLSPAEAAQVIAQQTLAVAEAEAVRRVVHDSTNAAEEEIDAQAFSIPDTAKGIDAQALSPAHAEASIHACDDSTDEDGEGIDAQAFSTPDTKEDALNGHDSTTDNAEEIETQALSPADTEESVRACDDSTTNAAKGIDTQAFSATDVEEGALYGHDSTTNAEEGIDAQAFSTTGTEEGARNGHDSTTDNAKGIDAPAFSNPDTEEEALYGHDSTTDAAKGIEKQVLSPADAKESVRACDDSTADAAKGIETQALSPADAEESIRSCDDSTTDAAKGIDAPAFSNPDTEEEALNGHDSTTDAAKDIEKQALSLPDAAGSLGTLPFSADKGRWGVRSPRGPDPPTDDGHDSNAIRQAGADAGNDFTDAENNFTAQPSNFSADRHPPAAVGTALAADPPIFAADECRPLRTLTEKHPYLNPSFHEPHPLLRLHPPSIGGFGRTFRVQSAQPPFGRPFLGRFVDIRPACTVGSRPLRPRLALCRTERGRCRLEHPDRECTTSANAAERSANAIRPPEDGHEHGTDERKNADFIDADPVRGHKTERNADEHANDERKRHDPAPEHPANAVSTPADECPDPAYDPDAGQRLLDTAAHRRAVRAEREACCGALRHLAHCCVAF